MVISLLVFLALGTITAMAAPTEYYPLAPLSQAQSVTSSTYIPHLFRLGIGIAGGLAVLAIAFGGIRYMLSDVVTTKSEAIQGIKNALLGLLLTIAAFLILRTINPDLVNLKF
jgi:Type IV secretion system pilin